MKDILSYSNFLMVYGRKYVEVYKKFKSADSILRIGWDEENSFKEEVCCCWDT
jgi:hypothetical protein